MQARPYLLRMRSTACRRRSGLTSLAALAFGSRGNILENLLLKRQIGDKAFQASILTLQVFHSPGLVDFKTAVFLSPPIVTLLRYGVAINNLVRCSPRPR